MFVTKIEQIVAIFAPHNCLICGKEGKIVCSNCALNVIERKSSTCFLCNKLEFDFRTCVTCRKKTKVRGVIIASHYQNNAKKLVHLLKYRQAREASIYIAELLSEMIDSLSYDLITSVPAASRRYRQRGFNQASLIALGLARRTGVAYSEVLGRIGNKRQVGTMRKTRLAQVKGSFYVKNQSAINGKRILIVDDVVTTGATMSECGNLLKQYGAKSVWGAAFAKH
jgi:ComF family protein